MFRTTGSWSICWLMICGLTLCGAVLAAPAVAEAHFLWLVRPHDAAEDRLHVYFGELAEPDDPELLDRVAGAQAWRVGRDGALRPLKLDQRSESLTAPLGDTPRDSLFLLRHDYGVITRGGKSFLLRYYAKTGPGLGHAVWTARDTAKHSDLDLAPRREGDRVRVTVRWRGELLSGAQIKAHGPGIEEFEGTTDEQGEVAFALGEPGRYSIRARHIEDRAGNRDGEKFRETRHYATLTLPVGKQAAAENGSTQAGAAYPPIPEMVTSFGAAVLGDAVYVYGGHTGRAHSYDREAQANTLRRLDLKNPKAWEALGEGPGLQGLAMVAHGGKLYRIGGFTAKNQEGEDHDLWSQAGVACYDPSTNQWTDLSPLPEPRSSFDAAVLDGKIYVIGGWRMAGDAEHKWHTTAYVLDLNADSPNWQTLPEPPFQRRALSVAAHDGKIYAIGGMQQEGGPTTRTAIFDPRTGKWSEGPRLRGEPMDGFGSSAFATGGNLYVTTYSGKLQRLAEDGNSWEVVKELDRARFFHRLLPLSSNRLISLGGASMSVGKFAEVDVIDVP